MLRLTGSDDSKELVNPEDGMRRQLKQPRPLQLSAMNNGRRQISCHGKLRH